jgi:hypothetical protein
MKYLKLYESFSEITFSDVEDNMYNYIDDGYISLKESSFEYDNVKKRQPRNLSQLIYGFEYCLISEGEFQKDPFHFINEETDKDDYWNVKYLKKSSNVEGIYFELDLYSKFVKNFNSVFEIPEKPAHLSNIDYIFSFDGFITTVYRRRLIFEIMKEIFRNFQNRNKNVDVFYIITIDYSLDKEIFAKLQLKIENKS